MATRIVDGTSHFSYHLGTPELRAAKTLAVPEARVAVVGLHEQLELSRVRHGLQEASLRARPMRRLTELKVFAELSASPPAPRPRTSTSTLVRSQSPVHCALARRAVAYLDAVA